MSIDPVDPTQHNHTHPGPRPETYIKEPVIARSPTYLPDKGLKSYFRLYFDGTKSRRTEDGWKSWVGTEGGRTAWTTLLVPLDDLVLCDKESRETSARGTSWEELMWTDREWVDSPESFGTESSVLIVPRRNPRTVRRYYVRRYRDFKRETKRKKNT